MTTIIKSISFDQIEIINNIIKLHTGPIECDVTYGSGVFYKNIPRPPFCFDISPRRPKVIPADVNHLPIKDNVFSCVMFDPPFMARTGPGATLKAKFGELKGTIKDLWNFYGNAVKEIHRVLKPEGWLIMKCQDGVLAGVNNFTHVVIMNRALEIGLKPVDLFVLLATHRMMHPKHKRQVHARKYHSYFLVFQKNNKRKIGM
jgi:hypothetical protein